MLKNLFYAILLGVGMAACLSENSSENTAATQQVPEDTPVLTEENTVALPAPEYFVIRNGSVGTIEIGMPVEAFRNNVTAGFAIADTTLLMEGQSFTAYKLHVKDKPEGILVEQQCKEDCKVWRIHVKSTDFKTATGIGVGSKYSEVLQYYPVQTVVLADGGLVAISEEAGMSFVLETAQIPASQRSRLTPATVPANTLVKSILVY